MNSNIKRVLFLSPWPPLPKDSGGAIVSGTLLEQYFHGGYSIDLVFFVDKSKKQEQYKQFEILKQYCESIHIIYKPIFFQKHKFYNLLLVIKSLVFSKSFRYYKFYDINLYQIVNALINRNNYTLIHNEIYSLNYDKLDIFSPYVYVQHNIDYLHFFQKSKYSNSIMRKYYLYQSKKIFDEEKKNLRKMDVVITMGHNDEIVLEKQFGIAKNKLLRFNYDFKFNHQNYSISSLIKKRDNIIFSLGNLSDPKRAEGTRWFFHKVYPIIMNVFNDFKWYIIGSNPPNDIKKLGKEENIEVFGYVNNLDNILSKCKICIIPILEGTGRLMKIESMAEKLIPSITTEFGYINCNLKKQEEIFVYNKESEFAGQIINLLKNENIYHSAIVKLSKYCSEYTMINNISKLEKLL